MGIPFIPIIFLILGIAGSRNWPAACPYIEAGIIYTITATMLSLPAKLASYRNMGAIQTPGYIENRIKELKEDFGVEGISMDSFCATETVMQFIMVADNLMSLFRQSNHQKQGSSVPL